MRGRHLRARFRWHPERALWALVGVAIALVLGALLVVAWSILAAMVALAVAALLLVAAALFAWRVRKASQPGGRRRLGSRP